MGTIFSAAGHLSCCRWDQHRPHEQAHRDWDVARLRRSEDTRACKARRRADAARGRGGLVLGLREAFRNIHCRAGIKMTWGLVVGRGNQGHMGSTTLFASRTKLASARGCHLHAGTWGRGARGHGRTALPLGLPSVRAPWRRLLPLVGLHRLRKPRRVHWDELTTKSFVLARGPLLRGLN